MAWQDVHITGSDALSYTGTSIIGQNVAINVGLGSIDNRQTQWMNSGGNVGLTVGVVSSAEGVYTSAHHAGQVDDDRLNALYAVQADYQVYDAVQNGDDAKGAAKPNGVSVRMGLGASD